MDAVKAWECLRYLYFKGEMPAVFRTVIERGEEEINSMPGYDLNWKLPYYNLISASIFPETSWSKILPAMRNIYASPFNEQAGKKNLRPLQVRSVADGVFNRQFFEYYTSDEDFYSKLVKFETNKILKEGELRHFILEVDLSIDDKTLMREFEKLLRELRGKQQLKASKGAKPTACDVFKGLVIEYHVNISKMKQEAAAQGTGKVQLYGNKYRFYIQKAREAHNKAKEELNAVRNAMDEEANCLAGLMSPDLIRNKET